MKPSSFSTCLTLFFIIVVFQNIDAQEEQLRITYDAKITTSEFVLSSTINADLNQLDSLKFDEYYIGLYKSQQLNELTQHVELVGGQSALLRQNLNIIEWEIKPASKSILGLVCQKAVGSYGGRTYVAYFNPSSPFKGGPWKFQGVPGLILEVESIDKEVRFNATSVKTVLGEVAIKNPFNGQKSVTWDEYIALNKKTFEKYKIRMNMPNLTTTGGSNIEKLTF